MRGVDAALGSCLPGIAKAIAENCRKHQKSFILSHTQMIMQMKLNEY